ncbi:MAG TPA: hypothetical protein VIJ79_11930 [Acidobacteriaceae bacterium]
MKPHVPWPEAMATVTACHYEAGAGSALAFGVPTTKHFRIAYNYWANGELHTGEYNSATAVAQGTLFPITYDPAAPHEHIHSTPSPRSAQIIIGIAGSIILSLAWFAFLRGCH